MDERKTGNRSLNASAVSSVPEEENNSNDGQYITSNDRAAISDSTNHNTNIDDINRFQNQEQPHQQQIQFEHEHEHQTQHTTVRQPLHHSIDNPDITQQTESQMRTNGFPHTRTSHELAVSIASTSRPSTVRQQSPQQQSRQELSMQPATATQTGKRKYGGNKATEGRTSLSDKVRFKIGSIEGNNRQRPVAAGRWTPVEHQAFLLGMAVYGREWKKVAEKIPTRTSAQVRSHAQKYFSKLERQLNNSTSNDDTGLSDDCYYDLDITTTTQQQLSSSLAAFLQTRGAAGAKNDTDASTSSRLNGPSLLPPMRHLSDSARQEAVRIMTSPDTVEQEVQETLQRLHERYRQLQLQLQRRQEQRQQQQLRVQEQQEHVAHQIIDEPQNRMNELTDEPERHQNPVESQEEEQDNDLHRHGSELDTSNCNCLKVSNENVRNVENGEDVNPSPSSISISPAVPSTHRLNQDRGQHVGVSGTNSSNGSLTASTNNDSSSSLFMLAESVVQVHNEKELIALNVLQNGLLEHLLSEQRRSMQCNDPTEVSVDNGQVGAATSVSSINSDSELCPDDSKKVQKQQEPNPQASPDSEHT